MAKRIPEKYINGGMLIGFIILMGIIGYGIWTGAQTLKLHSKLNTLGFEVLEHGLSKDHVRQITYIKDRNLSWI